MAMQEDDDMTGDVISVNGEAQEPEPEQEEAPAKPDRGDEVTQDEKPDDKPDEAKADDKPEVADPPKDEPKPQHIPKVRFDEVNNKKNELAAQLEEANRQLEELRQSSKAMPAAPLEQSQAFDEAAAERAYLESVLDGDTDKALQIRAEINANNRRQAAQEFEVGQNARSAAQDLQRASTQAVADFPYLNTEDGAEALELIVAARDAKAARGIPLGEALRQAVASIAPRFRPLEDDTPGKGLPEKAAPKDTRTANALARGAADSNLQPPSLQVGTGNRTTAGRVNVEDMTEEQFENMSSAERKRLRGDV